MAASMQEIRKGLKDRLETIPLLSGGGRVFEFLPGTQDPPSVTIVPGTFIPGDSKAAITFDRTMERGSHDYVFTLAVVVSTGQPDDRLATQLDSLLSTDTPDSIVKAIEADDTLGGKVSFSHVDRVLQYGALTWNGMNFFGAQVIVEVTA